VTGRSERPEIRSFEQATASARALMTSGRRRILGIVGAPGAGKSTLAAALVRELGPKTALVPMDGFHLAQAELERLVARHLAGGKSPAEAYAWAHGSDQRNAELVVATADAADRSVSAGVIAEVHRRVMEDWAP